MATLIIDCGAHLKPTTGLDHAAQDKEAGPEALSGESPMVRIGDAALAMKEGEQRALIDAAEPRSPIDSRTEQIGHAFIEITELGVSPIGERQDGDGSWLDRQF
jgi:hypothetical protein